MLKAYHRRCPVGAWVASFVAVSVIGTLGLNSCARQAQPQTQSQQTPGPGTGSLSSANTPSSVVACRPAQLHLESAELPAHGMNEPVAAALLTYSGGSRCMLRPPTHLVLVGEAKRVPVAFPNRRTATIRPGEHPFVSLGWASNCRPGDSSEYRVLEITWSDGVVTRVHLSPGWPLACTHPFVSAYLA
jgi:hypothetical protein